VPQIISWVSIGGNLNSASVNLWSNNILSPAYMNNLEDKEADIHSGLLEHMRTVKEKTGQDWENDLNASFTATQMVPYAIEAM
jgi:hypothetical protein